jgi:hypothetical protein
MIVVGLTSGLLSLGVLLWKMGVVFGLMQSGGGLFSVLVVGVLYGVMWLGMWLVESPSRRSSNDLFGVRSFIFLLSMTVWFCAGLFLALTSRSSFVEK